MTRRNVLLIPGLIAAFALGMATSALTAERHPQIAAALQLLGQAQERLKHADGDFEGHKLKAMEHIKIAFDELGAALRADSR